MSDSEPSEQGRRVGRPRTNEHSRSRYTSTANRCRCDVCRAENAAYIARNRKGRKTSAAAAVGAVFLPPRPILALVIICLVVAAWSAWECGR